MLNVQKEKDKIQPMDVSLFLNRTGTSPNKIVDKSKQFTPSPYAYRPKNQPKPTYAKPTQYGSFDSKTKRMVQTTKKPKNINNKSFMEESSLFLVFLILFDFKNPFHPIP